MGRVRWLGIGLLVAATARCGYPDFQFTTTTTTPCHLLGTTGCGMGQRCTVVEASTGTTGCVADAAMPLHTYDACSSDTECPSGTWCDGRSGACSPFCQSASDCDGSDCVAANTSTMKTIPGASVCTANCDPVSAKPCGAGTTCQYDPLVGATDCLSSSGIAPGQICMFLNDCGPGLICVGKCQPFCHPAGHLSADCGGGPCDPISNLTVTYDGATYGACAPPP